MKKKFYLAAAALALVATLGIGSAMAYFTTYVLADGGVEVSMGSTVTIPKEDVVNAEKIVTIQNTGDYDCWIRVKAFAGEKYNQFSYSDANGKWTPGADGYYYYSDIVPAGGETEAIKILITELTVDDSEMNEAFNVIVVQECTPVLYDEAGEAYADWNANAEVLNKEVE